LLILCPVFEGNVYPGPIGNDFPLVDGHIQFHDFSNPQVFKAFGGCFHGIFCGILPGGFARPHDLDNFVNAPIHPQALLSEDCSVGIATGSILPCSYFFTTPKFPQEEDRREKKGGETVYHYPVWKQGKEKPSEEISHEPSSRSQNAE
jgi:hypothetical protein